MQKHVKKFTEQQLQDWREYEDVRESGQFNMLFPQAREATGLPRDRYLFVMENYSELEDAVAKHDSA